MTQQDSSIPMGFPSIATKRFRKGQIGDLAGKPGNYCDETLNLHFPATDSTFVSFQNSRFPANLTNQQNIP
jgi:hypothetical protein